MSSIRKVQIEQALADIVRLLYSEGVKPTNSEIHRHMAEYFSKYPAGSPLPVDPSSFLAEGARSDPKVYNETMLKIIVNLDTLYRATMEQVDDVMDLTTDLNDKLKLLRDKRRRLATKIDDYLLGLYNTDGYFYSISDAFTTLDLVDLDLTSAYVDTDEGSVSLPIVSRLSTRLPAASIDDSHITATVDSKSAPIIRISPFSYAVDGNTNTVWSCEVDSSTVQEAVITAVINIEKCDISKIEVDPYGMTPAQWSMEYGTEDAKGTLIYRAFGSQVLTTGDKFAFRDDVKGATALRLTIRKTRHDYEKQSGSQTTYRYIFGAKELAVSYQSYDTNASLVTVPLGMSTDESDYQAVIDAVSLTATNTTPPGTTLKFFVAEDQPDADSLSDFEWRALDLVDESSDSSTSVRFDGAQLNIKRIVDTPTVNDLQRIAFDSTNGDPNSRNPNRNIIDGVDVYRLAKFDEQVLLNSIRIDEGVNTTRIYHLPLDPAAVDSLEWWTERSSAQLDYAQIDTGNEFFYGGDIGESARSVMVETYVDIPGDIEPIVSALKKVDPNSATWKVRAFLNGTEVAYLDTAVKELSATWPFKKGLNHVCLLINIPAPSTAVPNPYVGTIDLLSDGDLFDYGTVKLGTLDYIDFFDMQHNQTNDAKTFTIHNGELISKHKPTGNLRVVYAKQTNKGPAAIRLRADFGRSDDSSSVSPSLNQYRLRFSYSESE